MRDATAQFLHPLTGELGISLLSAITFVIKVAVIGSEVSKHG